MSAKIFGDGMYRVAAREITPDIWWLSHCLGDHAKDFYQEYFASLPNAEEYATDRIVDYPFSAFLILDEKPLLIDTVGPKQEENMLKALDYILGDRMLAYIWISHIELPHAGNAAAIKRQYPEAELVTVKGGDHYQLHSLQNAIQVGPGDVMELGKHVVEMVDPLFVDHGLSQWLYERTTGFFFTADWGHNLHAPACGECFQFVDEMMAGTYTNQLYVDDVKVNAWYQFPWLTWADPDELAEAVADLFEQYDVKIFAPSHGNIIRENVPHYIPMLVEGMRRAAAMPFSQVY